MYIIWTDFKSSRLAHFTVYTLNVQWIRNEAEPRSDSLVAYT